ncbi:MAG: rRNA pseudouridine synthase [Bacteroidales bacterium]|nr:rRNA pseudouridine synthase [Bacteroidales bacterium]NLK82197.1 rRNA pseudouridine synthase [Bacteroidales bacterium]
MADNNKDFQKSQSRTKGKTFSNTHNNTSKRTKTRGDKNSVYTSKTTDTESSFSQKSHRKNAGSRPRIKVEKNTSSHSSSSTYKEKLRTEMRLNRFIANAGYCSRREADDVIRAGKVTVNGKTIHELGVKVNVRDVVHIDGVRIQSQKKVYILFNKPKDCITTKKDPEGRKTVYDLIAGACTEAVEAVGRLDRNTTGLLLFTNDGDLAHQLTHPKYEKMKIYHAFLNKNLQLQDFEKITEGVEIDGELIKPDDLQYVAGDKSQLGIQIHSGKYHIVKRIFEAVGYKVKKLDRVYFAGLTKKNLPRGKWRFLTEKEISVLKQGAYE